MFVCVSVCDRNCIFSGLSKNGLAKKTRPADLLFRFRCMKKHMLQHVTLCRRAEFQIVVVIGNDVSVKGDAKNLVNKTLCTFPVP